MLMKSQDEQLYPEFFIRAPLILEGWIVMFSLTYPPWYSRMENNLNIFVAELSDFNRKLYSMDIIRLPYKNSIPVHKVIVKYQ